MTAEDSSKIKVLIVDDIPTNRLLLKAILKKEALTLEMAENGIEALRLVDEFRPDLILLDIMMPGLNGYEVAAELRKNKSNDEIAIIFITAIDSTESIVKAFKLGGNDYITKPFIHEELKTRILHQVSILLAKRKIEQQYQELKKNIEWRDRLYSVIAHDLRDPIGTIKMLLNILINCSPEESKDEFFIESLQLANKSAEEVFNLLDNLLKWTKSQVGSIDIVPQKFKIDDLVNGTISFLCSVASVKNINLVFDQSVEIKELCADYEMIKTVLRNIVNNAIKFSFENSEIVIGVSYDENYATIHVRDFGVGIKEEDMFKIKNKSAFFTSSGTKNESGSGLGLMLCYQFVELNGGKLDIQSTYGEGSTLSFSVPLYTKPVSEVKVLESV